MYELLFNAMHIECGRRDHHCSADAPTREHLERIAIALTKPSEKFGILLTGIPGNGKTTTAWAVRRVLNHLHDVGLCDEPNMRLVEARDVANIAKKEPDVFETYTYLPGLIIDDLGDEPTEKMVYGSIETPTTDLLLKRYSRRLFTICTSNLRPEDLRAKYGERLSDRFREMFHVIGFTNPSYRWITIYAHNLNHKSE